MLIVSYSSSQQPVDTKGWYDLLDCVPILGYGGLYPQEIWASCMMNVPFIADTVKILVSDKFLKLDRFKVLGVQAKENASPSEYMECIDMDLADHDALFVCHPNRTMELCSINLEDFITTPETVLTELFKEHFIINNPVELPEKPLISRLLFNITSIKDSNLCPWKDLWLPDGQQTSAYMQSLLDARAIFDVCLLPFLLECMQDCKISIPKRKRLFQNPEDKKTRIDLPDIAKIDLEMMFYGLCCKQYAFELQKKLVQMLKSGCSLIELQEIWKDMLECYVEDPRILTAHQHHIGQNDPCPCDCGNKWKKHYGMKVDNIMKIVYPKMQYTFGPMPEITLPQQDI